jgi:hypothetical protein
VGEGEAKSTKTMKTMIGVLCSQHGSRFATTVATKIAAIDRTCLSCGAAAGFPLPSRHADVRVVAGCGED